VLHVDENPYYGGSDASLSLTELSEWARQRASDIHASEYSEYMHNERSLVTHVEQSPLPDELKRVSRNYSLSLFPSLVPSVCPLVDTLVSSRVSRYSSFKLLEGIAAHDSESGGLRRVPMNKESVFEDDRLSLIDKRRLMKFLAWAATDWEADQVLESMHLTFHIPGNLACPDSRSRQTSKTRRLLTFCAKSSRSALDSLMPSHTR
jgi:RAB protein geranylgeranyltransferase component A